MDRRKLLLGSGTIALGATALQALPTFAATRPAPASGMVVEAVQMPAWTGTEGKRRPLSPGDTVSTAQEVETAAAAALVLKMPEGSLIRLGEKTRLGVQRLEVNPEDGRMNVRSELKLFDGFFRFATSAVAKAAGQRQIDVSLRTATIGIRGTDFWSMTDAAHDAACLFEGKVDLATRDQGALTLEKPTAFWARFFDKPVQPVGNATPDELAKFLKSTELQPGKGVAIVGGRWRVVAAALADGKAAAALSTRLRAEGYPAIVKAGAGARKANEVRINGFASREDAQAILEKIAAVQGVQGRVALSA
jgi:hypothetical protein